MGFSDYFILAAVAVWTVASLVYLKKRKKKGKCIGCGGDCAHCAKQNKKED